MVVLSCYRWRNHSTVQGGCGLWEGMSIYRPRTAIKILTGECVHTVTSIAAVKLLLSIRGSLLLYSSMSKESSLEFHERPLCK